MARPHRNIIKKDVYNYYDIYDTVEVNSVYKMKKRGFLLYCENYVEDVLSETFYRGEVHKKYFKSVRFFYNNNSVLTLYNAKIVHCKMVLFEKCIFKNL